VLPSGRLVAGVAAVRADGDALVPIIPGSSLKGAVRAVAEAITPSCERVSVWAARSTWRERSGAGLGAAEAPCRTPDALCPACRTFGAPGWRAMVGFGDLGPDGAVPLEERRVAQRYSHPGAPRRGRRLYRREPEEPPPQKEETLAVVPEGRRFRGAIYLDGADLTGLGLLLLALGIPPHGVPHLRLGGGKNRALGTVEAKIDSGRIYRSLASWVRGERLATADGELARFLKEAEEEAIRTYPGIRDALDRIAQEYRGPEGGERR
jgi:CRISPR/Cas system CSM-associated protein Csm3 (group 7 of RAMP superfamily)